MFIFINVFLRRMFKRLLSILLLFLYLIPSIGVSGSVHYCGGEVAAIVIIPTDEHPCPCGPSEPMDDDCCKDKDFSIKIKDNHKNADSKVIINDISDDAFMNASFSYVDLVTSVSSEKKHYRIKEKEPPDIKLFVLYESYII